ncbi:uncharacterized protein LOC123558805 [Mercenaria mercenaria]|uniref:uncharacterized protein LOC123558805 n=1 Tax=Mercenaria mercenaria TaxID=6596 RepID=UPI00234E7054|nr:uncharacterized protein LOC123558805 [Mercenaria mercenaria]
MGGKLSRIFSRRKRNDDQEPDNLEDPVYTIPVHTTYTDEYPNQPSMPGEIGYLIPIRTTNRSCSESTTEMPGSDSEESETHTYYFINGKGSTEREEEKAKACEKDCSENVTYEQNACVNATVQESGVPPTQDITEDTNTTNKESKTQQLQSQETDCRHRYEEMINLYRKMLVSNVVVSQVLPHLQTCLSCADISAINGENNQQKAVELLLEKLSLCQERGKWKMFVQALEACKYQTIVDALRRKPSADNTDHITILHMFSPELRKMIVPSEITAELLRTDVINSDDINEIHQKERTSGAVVAADILLERIPGKHPKWFNIFLNVLRGINRDDLVAMLTFQTG